MMVELDSRPDVVAWQVIRGAGESSSAPAPIPMFADGNLEHAREGGRGVGRAFEALARFRGVSIAAINGYAMGAAGVALACDYPHRRAAGCWDLPEASVGLLPCAGGTQRLTELVGPGWAKRMILCGEKVSATWPTRWGWWRRW